MIISGVLFLGRIVEVYIVLESACEDLCMDYSEYKLCNSARGTVHVLMSIKTCRKQCK